MTVNATNTSDPRSRSRLQSIFGRDIVPAMFIGGPAFFGLILFLVIPAIFAFYLSFTNQRLLSPNPTEWVGLRNFDRVLSLTLLTLEPERDEDTGEVLRDEDGNIEYPRSRSITRTEERYEGFSEWFSIDIGQQRHVILAKDPEFYRSFINTFYFAALVLPLQIGVALAMALLINQKIPGMNLFRTIYFTPVVTSLVVVSLVWRFIYVPGEEGLLNQMLAGISGGLIGPFDWHEHPSSAMPSVVLLSAWQGMGLQMLIFLAGLQGISEDLYEAAGIDGANLWQKFRHVTIPSLRNTFIFIIISTTIAAFALFDQINILTQGGPSDSTTTVMYHIYRTGFTEQAIGTGATMSVIYFVVILIIALLQRRILRDEVPS